MAGVGVLPVPRNAHLRQGEADAGPPIRSSIAETSSSMHTEGINSHQEALEKH